MAQIPVFNPADTPVYIDNGKVVPVLGWATVKPTPLVKALVADGLLIDKTVTVMKEQKPAPTEPTVVNDESPSPDVESEEGITEVIDTDNQPKPASMKRRQKSPSPTKE